MAKTAEKTKTNPDSETILAILKRHNIKDMKEASIILIAKELNIRLTKKTKAKLRGKLLYTLYNKK